MFTLTNMLLSSQWALLILSEHFLFLSLTFKICLPLNHLCSHFCHCIWDQITLCVCKLVLHVHLSLFYSVPFISHYCTSSPMNKRCDNGIHWSKSITTTQHYSITLFDIWHSDIWPNIYIYGFIKANATTSHNTEQELVCSQIDCQVSKYTHWHSVKWPELNYIFHSEIKLFNVRCVCMCVSIWSGSRSHFIHIV